MSVENLSKQEMVEMLSRGVVSFDQNGLRDLMLEWVKSAGISRYTGVDYLVNRSQGSGVPYSPVECTMTAPPKTLKPIPVVVVRKTFEQWVDDHKKSPELSAWVIDQSDKAFGMAAKAAGIESKRFKEGIRYLLVIPGVRIASRRHVR